MTPAHPLDRPVWNALTGLLAPFATSDGPAVRLDPEVGVFLAAADDGPQSRAALNRLHLAFPGSGLVEHSDSVQAACLPAGAVASSSPCVQMTCAALAAGQASLPNNVLALGEADAPDMLALATLTRPGPFRSGTARLGGFVGVRHEGRLIAMAGTRLRVPGYTELSGVCVHPDRRGQGLAQGLSRIVCDRILATGEQVFLHAYAGHEATIRLYERLGFAVRAPMTYTVMATDGETG